MTASYQSLYQAHVAELQLRTRRLLERENLDALVIHSGQTQRKFLDDMDFRLKLIRCLKPGCRWWIIRTAGLLLTA